MASTARPSVSSSPILSSSPPCCDSARPEVSSPSMYEDSATRTFLCAGILRPPTSSVMSTNCPASRWRRSNTNQWPSTGGATGTSVGGSATVAAALAPPAAPRVVRRFAGLAAGLAEAEGRLRLEMEAAAAALRVDMAGAVLAAAVMAFPLVVRAIRLSIEAVDVRFEDAAATLGASPLRVFLTVTLPMAMPGVLAGAVLGFAKAMGEFGATITFVSRVQGETQTLSLAVYSFLQVPGGESAAVKLVIIAVAVAMGALLLSEWLARRMARKVSGA